MASREACSDDEFVAGIECTVEEDEVATINCVACGWVEVWEFCVI